MHIRDLAIVSATLLLSAIPALAAPAAGTLIKGSNASVYYYGSDGKRHVFPNEKTFRTWYTDFSTVRTISDSELASIPLGQVLTYRPGIRMVKVQSDPKVYVVSKGGVLRAIPSEAVAAALYGSSWKSRIDDVPDAFFVSYASGTPLATAADFSPAASLAASMTIAADRGLAIPSGTVDPHSLPIGDGKYKTSVSKGYIYACQQSFNGGGAFASGAWLGGSSWDPALKPTVDGSRFWTGHSFSMSVNGSNRVIASNDIPDHPTGTYPIASGDDAYSYDRNPNSISSQSLTLTLPKDPAIASNPSCVGGEVGIAVSGVPIFNGFDAGGRDAPAYEIQDSCAGHPQSTGQYHYHGKSPCVATGDSELFGYAFDGFGIFSDLENGKVITNADLDECHGHVHEISWDGVRKSMYHYHVTNEFPYTVACFKGTSTWTGPLAGQGGVRPPR